MIIAHRPNGSWPRHSSPETAKPRRRFSRSPAAMTGSPNGARDSTTVAPEGSSVDFAVGRLRLAREPEPQHLVASRDIHQHVFQHLLARRACFGADALGQLAVMGGGDRGAVERDGVVLRPGGRIDDGAEA